MEKRKFRHLTLRQRVEIESFLKAKWSKRMIAKELGVHISTIYREIKRGEYEKRRRCDWKDIKTYSADKANILYREHLSKKGKGIKIAQDRGLVRYLEEAIVKKRLSPEAALGSIRQQGLRFEISICTSSLYNYIRRGVFKNIRLCHLPFRGKRKRNQVYRQRERKRRYGPDIEKRAEEILSRLEFGHWEMDTVKGSRQSSKCLLVMTERKTRYEIIRLMNSGKAYEVVRILKDLKGQFGSDFSKLFRSITMDNGVEFSDYAGMLRVVGKHTEFYYCHPYSAWERGSNENQNRFIRRWWPKGTSFANKTRETVEKLESWVNQYPRRMFGYLTAHDMYQTELDLLYSGEP